MWEKFVEIYYEKPEDAPDWEAMGEMNPRGGKPKPKEKKRRLRVKRADIFGFRERDTKSTFLEFYDGSIAILEGNIDFFDTLIDMWEAEMYELFEEEAESEEEIATEKDLKL